MCSRSLKHGKISLEVTAAEKNGVEIRVSVVFQAGTFPLCGNLPSSR